jgi:uncharacterized membrane-anchored protein YhcB (DUF1043 family)
MIVLIFLIALLGLLIGLLFGALLCIRFIRQEVAADIGPRLRAIQAQLDAIEAEMGLAIGTRYAEASARLSQDPPRPLM